MIACFEQKGRFLTLPRGCCGPLEELLADLGVALELSDERGDGKPLEAQFTGQLTACQENAMRALLAHELGVLCAPPGIGKTVIATRLVAERARSTLVLVHRKPLLDQWVKRLAGPTTGLTLVKIKGTNILKTATVTIGAAATNVEWKSETEIWAKTAAGSAGEDEVAVTDAGGSGKSGGSDKFSYVTPPTVTSIAPSEGSTTGGTEVVIKGTGFEEHSKVTIGAAATEVEYVGPTELKAKTAAAAAGAKDKVVVTLPDGVESTGTTEFTYVEPPTVTGVTPAEGSTEGETVVKIKGTSFIKGAAVDIGGTAVIAAIVVSPTEIVAETAAHAAGKAAVVVSDKFGTSGASTQFTYVTPVGGAVVPAAVSGASTSVVSAPIAPLSAVASPVASHTPPGNGLRLAATVSGGQLHVHVTPAARRTGRLLITLRLVRGKQLLAVFTHTVMVANARSLTFTLTLPAAARRAATELRASAAYVGHPGVASRTVTVVLARTSHSSR